MTCRHPVDQDTAYGAWVDMIGFSCLVMLVFVVIAISVAVIIFPRCWKLPGARDRRQQRGLHLGKQEDDWRGQDD